MNYFFILSPDINKIVGLAFKAMKVSRQFLLLALTVCLINISMPNLVKAAAGDLDLTFGMGGKLAARFSDSPQFFASARDVITQPDGKILIGATTSVGATFDFGIARYYPDGTPDTSFGIGGKVITDFNLNAGFDDQELRQLLLQPDGKILAVGADQNRSFLQESRFAIVRYHPDGSLDSSFGAGGKVTTGFFGGFGGYGTAMNVVIQADGKIVVAGFSINGLTYFILVRYNINGTLDTSFGSGGKVLNTFGNGGPNAEGAQAYDVKLRPNGKIVASGAAYSPTNSHLSFVVAQFNPDGSRDTSFGNGGFSLIQIAYADRVRSMALLPDGKILLAGQSNNLTTLQTNLALARCNADGTLDQTFGVGGIIPTFPVQGLEPVEMVVQPNKKIVIAVFPFGGPESNFTLMRCHEDGSLDGSFGSGGVVSTDFFGAEDITTTVALQEDGKIIAAGSVYDSLNNRYYFGLARYHGDPIDADVCLQDDTSGNLLKFHSTTGTYQFTRCGGATLGGTGTVIKRGCIIMLEVNTNGRRINAKVDTCQNKGTASVQLFSPNMMFTISDRNTANNACVCP